MNILNVKISNERLSTDRKVMISNSVNYEHAFFTFDSEWDSLEKIATFTNTVTKVEKLMAVNPTTNMCVVPWECISKDGYLVICVKGSKTFADPEEDVVVYTKMEDPIKILKSDMGTGGTEPLPPTEDIISQIKAIADEALVKSTNAENISTGIMEMANNGDFDGRSITNTIIDNLGFLLVYYDDGTYENVGSVVGHDAVGISSSVITNGNLIITYTDGDIVNVGRVVGADGTDGEDGLDGKSLEYNWDGTRLGIRVVGDLEYVYQELNPYITAIDGDVLDEDSLLFKDNSDSLLKKISFSNIKAKLKEYFDTLYDSALHILSRIKEVDGAGSGLDSDFVDGMDTSYTASANTVVVRGADGSSEFNSINLDATPDISALKVGSVYYDADEVGLSVKVSDDVTIQVNKESYETLYNDDAVQIPNGSVVYWSSAIGASGFMRTKRFIGDGTVDSERMVGVATQDIPIGEKGIITSKGKVRDINTSGALYGEAWVDGEVLYASPTIAGGLTKIKPSKPNNVIKIGEVIRSHASSGILYVNPIVIYGTSDLVIDDSSPSSTKTYSSQKIESISGGGSYTLPTMSESIKGGAKVGNNLEIVNEVLNVTGVVTEETDPTVPEWAKQSTKPTYTKSEIGLGNVDNTSDINKPISTSVQSVFNSHIGSNGSSHALATETLPGFISPEEKIKLSEVVYNEVGINGESLIITSALNASANIPDGSITERKLTTEVQEKLNATSGDSLKMYIPIYPISSPTCYWNTSGSLIETVSGEINYSMVSATNLTNYIPVLAGEQYRVTIGAIFAGTSPTQIIFLNDSNVKVATAWTDATARTNAIITVPTNATRMHITFWSGANFKMERVEAIEDKESNRVRNDIVKFEHLSKMEQNQNIQQKIYKQTYKPFSKAYLTFVIDDNRPIIDVIANEFQTAGIPCCAGAVTENGTLLGSASLGTETKLEVLKRMVANGGEVLSHHATPLTDALLSDYDVMYEHFATVKKTLESYGFDVNGVILAGGTGQVAGDKRSDMWAREYYKYTDLYGQVAYGVPYYKGRNALSGYTTVDQVKTVINNAITNKQWIVFYMHDFADFSQANLTELLTWINTLSDSDVECVTYKQVYDAHITSSIDASGITLSSIEATKVKTTYTVGDTLNINDISAMATYSNGNSYEVVILEENVDVSVVNMSVAGSYSLNAKYQDNGIEKEDAISITVLSEAVTLTGFTASKVVTSYVQGSVMDTTDITGVATFSDTSTQNLTYNSLTIPLFDMNTVGTRNLAVEYTFNGTTLSYNIPIIITESVVDSGVVKNTGNADAGTWTLYSSGEIVINGTIASEIANYSSTSMPWYSYMAQITKVTYTGLFTSTGGNVFNGASNLVEVVTPSNLVKVGASAFQNCSKLATIDFTNFTSINLYSFRGCTSLPSTIVLGATTLANDSFYVCNNIVAINFLGIPTSISTTAFTNITAFNNSTNLLNIRVPWALDAVANAPWRATSATITYDWTP